MATKSVGGRPPKYTSKEEIAEKIDQYFNDCDGELLRDPETGNAILDKFNNPIYLNRRPPTSAGLARALGFKSRTSLFEYKGKKEFKEVIPYKYDKVSSFAEGLAYFMVGNIEGYINRTGKVVWSHLMK